MTPQEAFAMLRLIAQLAAAIQTPQVPDEVKADAPSTNDRQSVEVGQV